MAVVEENIGIFQTSIEDRMTHVHDPNPYSLQVYEDV